MPMQVTISDKVIREWANDVGLPVGRRGRLPQAVLAEFERYAQMSLAEKVNWLQDQLAKSEQRIQELEAERAEDKAIIRALHQTIDGLRRELNAALQHRDEWRDRAIILAGVKYAED